MYGTHEHSLPLLQTCRKAKILNCLEALHIQSLQQQQLLIDEQWFNDLVVDLTGDRPT